MWEPKGFPSLHFPSGGSKVGSVDQHQTVIVDAIDKPTIEVDLQFCETRDAVEKTPKMLNHDIGWLDNLRKVRDGSAARAPASLTVYSLLSCQHSRQLPAEEFWPLLLVCLFFSPDWLVCCWVPFICLVQHNPAVPSREKAWDSWRSLFSTSVLSAVWAWVHSSPLLLRVHGAVHQLCPHHPKCNALQWFRQHIHPHLFCWAICRFDLPTVTVNPVLDEEELCLDVLGFPSTGELSILYQ